MDEDKLVIEGIIDSIKYRNDENGYTVFTVIEDEESDEEYICVGSLPTVNEGENVCITGTVIVHPTYGEQLKVESCEQTIPSSEKGIERYLASGVIKGIGKVTARNIVKKFGKDTFKVISETPEMLSKIRGISEQKAMQIGEIFHEQTEMRAVVMFLQRYNVTTANAIKIYKRYKGNTISVVEKNPYTLADDIFGIGFTTADKIAGSMGIAPDSEYRIQAGINYILTMALNDGNVYLPLSVLLERTSQLLHVDISVIANLISKLHLESRIYIERTDSNTDNTEADARVYLNYSYYNECFIAKKLVELSHFKPTTNLNYDTEIHAIEMYNQMSFANDQRNAIKEALTNGVMVITGGPGTGKTTIINAIIALLKAEDTEVKLELAAPTGKAAKRMSIATGENAQTIHRLLGLTFLDEGSRKQSFDHDEDNPIDADVIITDESSMIDQALMTSLLKAIVAGTRLIIVGDADQLPSVGAGNILRDIIASDVIPVVRLTEIFRQARDSYIIMNAHRINNGQMPLIEKASKDFFFMRCGNQNTLIDTLVSLVTTRLPKYLGNCSPTDIQILTPMRKSPLGVDNLNQVLQSCLNPPDRHKGEKTVGSKTLRTGDKVMQIKNNYNITWRIIRDGKIRDDGQGIYNGDEGVITFIDKENAYLEVLFDGEKTVQYDFTQLDELELSYAVTIHKSQGSEYRAVVIPVHSGPPMLLTRNLIYTAVTRAKELVVLVGIPATLERMINNDKETERYTALSERLKYFDEL
jgi:exodeoxyribonuclease V alpha subunit